MTRSFQTSIPKCIFPKLYPAYASSQLSELIFCIDLPGVNYIKCFGQEMLNHGKSRLWQICGCTSIPTQGLDCRNLITLLAPGSLTGRFLTLKSNPQIRWLNLIYVDFMRARPPQTPLHSPKHRAKASSLQS